MRQSRSNSGPASSSSALGRQQTPQVLCGTRSSRSALFCAGRTCTNQTAYPSVQGARLIHGPVDGSGAAASASRSTFTPHVLADVPTSARLATEEAFAPVLTVSRFASATEAMDQVHALPLGLTTAIFGSLEEALPLARRVESGAVHLNGMTVHDQHALPFGGVKESGWGRFNGRGAIEAFTWTKNITFNDPHDLPLQAL